MMEDSPHDPDPVALEKQRRMAYDRSKWLQTCTYEIAKYEYNREELNQFYEDLKDVVGRIKTKFVCSLCGTFPRKTFVLRCGHLFCAKCASSRWNQGKDGQSTCPKCKVVQEPTSSFFAVDSIVNDVNTFLKEARYFQELLIISDGSKESSKKLKNMNFALLTRLKNIECQLMCDYCFNRISKTFLVNCATNAPTYRPFCDGCDGKYIQFYEKEQGQLLKDSFRLETYDSIVVEFFEFLDSVVDYSKKSKTPMRFQSSSGTISLFPVYKILVGVAILGIVLMYYSS